MPTSNSLPQALPSDIPFSLADLPPYLVRHWGEEMAVISGAPLAFSIAVIVAGIIAWLIFRFRHGRQLDEIPILVRQNAAKDEDLKRARADITRLAQLLEDEKKQDKIGISTLPPSNIFHIASHATKLHWSEQGKDTLQPFHPKITVPDNATLTLQIQVKITSIPRRYVENIQLKLTGQHVPLSAQEWTPKIIGQYNNLPLYFKVPSFIPNGKHSATLIVTIKEEDLAIPIPSSPFDIILTRSYDDLPKRSS